MERPLEGVRVLAFTQLGAGPYAMTLLGDLGAEIVKVEDPLVGGDEARNVPPHAEDGDSLYFQALNRNAASITLNLRVPEGRDTFHRLVRAADAVYANPRGDLPARLGLDYASLAPINPRIVCCTLTGFGRTGPRAAEPAYDYMLQGIAGFMSVTGEPDAPPTRCGVSVVDFSGGTMSALALMVGLFRARVTGVGCDVDVSLLDTAISMLNYLACWTLNRDVEIRRTPDSAHPTLVPAQNFPTRDGYIVVMCLKEKFWRRLTECIELPELADDPRFSTFAERHRNRDLLIPLLKERFRTRTTAEWLERLRGHVPCAPVNSIPEALRDEQVLARGMVVSVDHPRFGLLREVGCPIRVEGTTPRLGPASRLGADTERILREWAGLTAEEVDRLRQCGAV